MPQTNTTLNNIPICCCPHCIKTFVWDDYHDVKAGDERQCPHCEKWCHVLFADYCINVTLGTEADNS